MTLPKQGRRSIIVDDVAYYWVASGHDYSISLNIELAQQPVSRLFVEVLYEGYQTPAELGGYKFTQTTMISSSIVRKAIDYATDHGWKASTKGKDMHLAYKAGHFSPGHFSR